VLKNGYSNFSLEILEYCAASKCIEREQYYLDHLKPEYNILKVAGSSLGFKHSDVTKEKIRAYNLTPEQHAKHSKRFKDLYADPEFLTKRLEKSKIYFSSAKLKDHLKRLNSIKSHRVSVLDSLNNETTVYPSIGEAARAIGVSVVAIVMAFKYKGESTI